MFSWEIPQQMYVSVASILNLVTSLCGWSLTQLSAPFLISRSNRRYHRQPSGPQGIHVPYVNVQLNRLNLEVWLWHCWSRTGLLWLKTERHTNNWWQICKMQHKPPEVNLCHHSEVMQRDECGFKKYKTSEKVNTKKRKADGGVGRTCSCRWPWRQHHSEFMMLPRFVHQD